MPGNDKICVELAFNQGVSYSQCRKVRDFWKYMDDAKPLQSYEETSEPAEKQAEVKEDHDPSKSKRMWYKQFKVFKEHGLDKVALAAVKECSLCNEQTDCRCSEFGGAQEESYDELLEDMKAFDERVNEQSKANLA